MLARSLIGAGLVAHAGPALAPIVPAVARALGVATRAAGYPGALLTFDDGPHPQGTPAVLEALDEAGLRAVFFLCGEQVERDPGLAGEIAAAGHEIGVHCYRHRNYMRLAPLQQRDDLERAAAAIVAATGVEPRLHRPPYGIYTGESLCLVRRRGWLPLLWSKWGRDWRKSIAPARIAELVTTGASAGDVILLHDADHYSAPGSWQRTVAALPLILAELERRNLVAHEQADFSW